jgi:UDP-N-acetyl-D-mannosaminuronic acid transferase (WecB/TagA/CpsF family)
MKNKIVNFLGINFYEAKYQSIINKLEKNGGYVVIPAASALATYYEDKRYQKALKKSTIALFDSSFFCLLLVIFKFKKFKKFSGYRFIKLFLSDFSMKNKKILLLESSNTEKKINLLYFKSKKFRFIKNYVCPIYKKDGKQIRDKYLIKFIKNYRPKFIISNIGGQIQEPLALYIKNNVRHKCITICSGAALSFITGSGAKITDLIDKLNLGWLSRIVFNPVIFFPRIFYSLKLISIVFKSKIKILNC